MLLSTISCETVRPGNTWLLYDGKTIRCVGSFGLKDLTLSGAGEVCFRGL